MNGRAPKSPEMGSHAERVKNFQPNCAKLRCERRARMVRMKRTMTKMLQAHSNMTAAKLLSARRPLPRLLRNSRMGERVVVAGSGSGGPGAGAGVAANVAGTGSDDPGSRSVVMRVEDTIWFPGSQSPGADWIPLRYFMRRMEIAARRSGAQVLRAAKRLFDLRDGLADHILHW